ncbi:MAG: GNAT family N-acetyltransferase [Traorella sp.]
MKTIETKRLLLRNFEENDYEDLYEFLAQRKEDEFEAYPDITYQNGYKHLEYRLHNDEFIALQLKETGKVIGNIYLGNKEYNAKEIGYIINKNYQRKGYAKEALSKIIKELFKQGVHRIYAECAPANECSWKLLESLNFKREAHFKQNIYFRKDKDNNPIWQDTYVYSLLKE